MPAPRSCGIGVPNRGDDEEVGMVESSSSGGRYQIDAQKLWIGGLMAGIVAAGVAIVGLLIVMASSTSRSSFPATATRS